MENSKMMDLEKYKNDGWGLSKQQMTELLDIIVNHKNDVVRVVEFGSGKSTEFLGDITSENLKNVEIITFDDNPQYAYSGTHPNVELKIRNLVECTDEEYEMMFKSRKFEPSFMKPKQTPLTSRQKNNFYEIQVNDLVGTYDLMILDGPNGNGRNISFLHMVDHLDVGSIVLIDDYTHYDFVEKFSLFFNFNILHEMATGGIDQWNNGGNYKILEITSKNENI